MLDAPVVIEPFPSGVGSEPDVTAVAVDDPPALPGPPIMIPPKPLRDKLSILTVLDPWTDPPAVITETGVPLLVARLGVEGKGVVEGRTTAVAP